jgi:hypothetical protein
VRWWGFNAKTNLIAPSTRNAQDDVYYKDMIRSSSARAHGKSNFWVEWNMTLALQGTEGKKAATLSGVKIFGNSIILERL